METAITNISSHFEGTNYTTVIKSNDHQLIADEPIEDGGQNEGFSPYELVLAGLAACTTATLKMYADRKQWKVEKIDVQLSMQAENGIQYIKREITLIGDLDEEQRKRMMMIAEKCPVHKMLTNINQIATTLSEK